MKLSLNTEQGAALAALADGIIPADEMDQGAAAVEAGPRLAAKEARTPDLRPGHCRRARQRFTNLKVPRG
jgi:hypothetical protein